jgi:hypothetical protein
MDFWLVVWNIWKLVFHSVGNFIIPTDELNDFSEGRYTTNQILEGHHPLLKGRTIQLLTVSEI